MDQTTITTYNTIANNYDLETSDFWQRFPLTFISKFAEISGKRVLDVGSGPGRDGLLLQQLGKDVICVDASEAMVKLSSERGLTSLVANFYKLPFADKTFDAVWSYTALMHVSKNEVDISLSEIERILKVGGVFALGLIEGTDEGYKTEDGHSRWFSYYQIDEVEKKLASHGFKKVSLEVFKPGPRNYMNFLFKK